MDTQYQHYERLVLVTHDEADMTKYRPQALEIAQFCERWDMRYEEIHGSDDYVRRLVEIAMDLAKAREPNFTESDFLMVPPGGEIRQEVFI